jgi:hypothetical protein
VLFDIDGDGSLNRITWTERGTAIAFLALDRNGNGSIDDGTELFGTATFLKSGSRATNGFEVLTEFDSNHDGLVDVGDEGWQALLLWTDTNHDARSQPEELGKITTSSVRVIETTYHWTNRRDSVGNVFRYKGVAHFDRGARPVWDVYFTPVP